MRDNRNKSVKCLQKIGPIDIDIVCESVKLRKIGQVSLIEGKWKSFTSVRTESDILYNILYIFPITL